jgi:hypothetical protein
MDPCTALENFLVWSESWSESPSIDQCNGLSRDWSSGGELKKRTNKKEKIQEKTAII